MIIVGFNNLGTLKILDKIRKPPTYFIMTGQDESNILGNSQESGKIRSLYSLQIKRIIVKALSYRNFNKKTVGQNLDALFKVVRFRRENNRIIKSKKRRSSSSQFKSSKKFKIKKLL